MPTLDWIGKKAVVNHHNEVPYKTLELQYTYKEGKKNFDCGESENMIIHGDNLEALKSLLPKYEGKINCIYIDPPYNTGNEGWCYNDNVNSPQIQKWLGNIVGKESEDLTRHDKWLCMMYPRLKLLQKLLSDDGVIFISIDDNEQTNLKLILDEIYGERKFIGMFTWVRKKKGSFLSSKIRKMTEYVLCYQKSDCNIALYGENAYSDKWQPIVKRTNSLKTLVFPANIIETKLSDGTYEANYRGNDGTGVNFITDLIVKDGYVTNEIKCEGHFTWVQDFLLNEIKQGTRISLSSKFGFNVLRYDQIDKIKSPSTLINSDNGVGTNEDASQNLQDIFGSSLNEEFIYSKPYSLIEYLINMTTKSKRDSIILDSFAGSGTTAHAVLNLNKKDGGDRKFILIEMEDYAKKTTAERVKRVIDGYSYKGRKEVEIYKQELTMKNIANVNAFIEEAYNIVESKKNEYDKVSTPNIVDNCIKVIGTKIYNEKAEGLGGDFSFYELGEPLMNESGFINENQSIDRIQEYIWYTETHSPFKKNGTNGQYHLGIFNDVSYYFYYEKDRITTLDASFLNQEIKTKANQYIIYADNCLLSDELLKRFNIVFKKIPRDIRQF